MNILLQRTLCAVTLLLIVPMTQSQAITDKDAVLAQAESLLDTEDKMAAANYLGQRYAQIEPVEDSIAVLNSALQYYYERDAQQSLRSLAERALANIDPEHEHTWQKHSHAYGQLARYFVSVENDSDAAMPLLVVCDEGQGGDLETWCEHTRQAILNERRFPYRAQINERVSDKAASYWALLLIIVLSIGVFAYSLLRSPPAQNC